MLIFFTGIVAVVLVGLLSRDHDLSASQETIVTAEVNFSDAAITAMPERIHLSRPDGDVFMYPDRVRAASEGLLSEGFAIAGAYVIDELPGLAVVLFADPRNHMFATLYEHEMAGVWAETVSRYEDGARCIHTTLEGSGTQTRPGNTLVSLPGVPLSELLSRARSDRSPEGLAPAHKQDAREQFEADYAAWVSVRKQQAARGRLDDDSMDEDEQQAKAA